MKKVLFSILFLGVLLFPLVAFAGEYEADGQTIHFEGLVPCGKSEPAPDEDPEVTMPCQLCHFFVMAKAILDFIVEIVLVIGVLMLVIGGAMFLLGSGNPQLISRARSLLTSTVTGLLIIFGAWIFVNTFFLLIGAADWTGLREGWFIIDCPVQLPGSSTSSSGAGPHPAEGLPAELQGFFTLGNPQITPEEILHFNPEKNSGWFYIAQTIPENGIAFWVAAVRSLSTNPTDTSAQLLYGITDINTGEYYHGFLNDGSFSEAQDEVNLFYQQGSKKIIEFHQTEVDLSEFELVVDLPWNGNSYQVEKTITFDRPILYESGDGIVPLAEGIDSLYASLVLEQGFWVDFQKFNLGVSPLQTSSRFHEANHRWGSFILNEEVGPLPAGTVGVAWEILDENDQRQPGGYTNIDLLIPGYGQITASEVQIELVEIEEIEHWNSGHKTYLKKFKISYPGVDLLFETLIDNQENSILGNYFYEGMVKVFDPETGEQVGTGMLEQTHNEALD